MLTGHDVPAAGGGGATKERVLALALESGVIGQDDHDTQLRSERNRLSSTTPAAAMAPTRMQQDGKVVLHGAKLWERIGEPFASLDAAKQAMHRTEHGGNKAKWAANQKGCKRYWHCNFHEQCQVLLRISDHIRYVLSRIRHVLSRIARYCHVSPSYCHVMVCVLKYPIVLSCIANIKKKRKK